MNVYLAGRPDGGCGLFARRRFTPGQTVFRFEGTVVPEGKQSHYALQVGPDSFLESCAGWDNFLNHSCSPNCRIERRGGGVYLVARRDIQPGEEVTFDYATTEYDLLAQGCAFTCSCGSPQCRGSIAGYRYLTAGQRARLSGVAPYLLREAALAC